MALLDWIIIGAHFVLSAAIGLAYTKKAGESVSEFFVSGRSLPCTCTTLFAVPSTST